MEDFFISESTLRSLELMEKELGKLEKELPNKRKNDNGTFGVKLDFKIQNSTNETSLVNQFTNQTYDERSHLNKYILKKNESNQNTCIEKKPTNQEMIVENLNEKAKDIEKISNFSQNERTMNPVNFFDDQNHISKDTTNVISEGKRKASRSETTDTPKSILKRQKFSDFSQTCIPDNYKEIMLVNFDSKCIIEFNEPANRLDDPLSDPGILVIDTFSNYINEEFGSSFQRSQTIDGIEPKYIYSISSGDLGDLKTNRLNSQSNLSILESEMRFLIENSIDQLFKKDLMPVKHASIRKKNKKINLVQSKKPGENPQESLIKSDDILKDKIKSIESQLKEIKSYIKLSSYEKSNQTSDKKSLSSNIPENPILVLNNQPSKIHEYAGTSDMEDVNLTKTRQKEFGEFIFSSSVSCENTPKFHYHNMVVDQAIPIEICNVGLENSMEIEYIVKDVQIVKPMHCLFQARINHQSYTFLYSYSKLNAKCSDNYCDPKCKGNFPETRNDIHKIEKDLESECLKIISGQSGEYSERLINAIDSKNKERMLENAIKKVIMADFQPIWKSNEYKSTMSSTNPEMSESLEFKTKTSCSRPRRVLSDENLFDTISKRSDIKIQTSEIQSEFSQDDQPSRQGHIISDSVILSQSLSVKDKSKTKTIKSALVKTATSSSKLSFSRKENNLNFTGNETKKIIQKNKNKSQEKSNINYIVSCIIGEIRKQFRDDSDDVFTEASKCSSKQVTFDSTQNQDIDMQNNNQSFSYKRKFLKTMKHRNNKKWFENALDKYM